MGSGPRESRYDACSLLDETDDDVVKEEGIIEDGANAMTDEAETAANRADTSFMFGVRWVVSAKCILPVPRVYCNICLAEHYYPLQQLSDNKEVKKAQVSSAA